MSLLNEAAARLSVIKSMPKPGPGVWHTLEQLEVILWHFQEDGVSILAAEGVSGSEWHLTIRHDGAQRTYRAKRDEAVAS